LLVSRKVPEIDILAVLAETQGAVLPQDLHASLRARLNVPEDATKQDISFTDIHLKLRRLEEAGLVGSKLEPARGDKRPVMTVWIRPAGRDHLARNRPAAEPA
jgi:hypothetical protein